LGTTTPDPGRTHTFKGAGVVDAALARVAVEMTTLAAMATVMAVRED
jgi:hypothetical protein